MCLQTLCLVLIALFGIVLVLFFFLLLKSASRIWIAGVWERWYRGKLNPDDCYRTAGVSTLRSLYGQY